MALMVYITILITWINESVKDHNLGYKGLAYANHWYNLLYFPIQLKLLWHLNFLMYLIQTNNVIDNTHGNGLVVKLTLLI